MSNVHTSVPIRARYNSHEDINTTNNMPTTHNAAAAADADADADDGDGDDGDHDDDEDDDDDAEQHVDAASVDDGNTEINPPTGVFELSTDMLKQIPGEMRVVQHSAEQKVHVELLQLLEQAEAPDYLFKEVIDWASRAQASNYNFTPRLLTRNSVLSDLRQHFRMHNVRPEVSKVKLESVHVPLPIVSFDFKKQLLSLLTNTNLMQPENLVINEAILLPDGTIDAAPWFCQYQPSNGKLDEVLSGSWYSTTCEQLQVAPDIFVCPLIFYVDKTFIDPMRSRFNLEPLNFTLGIFKRTCRSQFKFWRTLGYIPELPVADETNAPAKGHKARIYHTLVKFLLRGLLEIHGNPSIFDNFQLRIGNHVKVVKLRIPVAFFISDTQGADKLCGRYVVYNDSISRLHRACLCPPSEAANFANQCVFVTMEEMMEVIQRGAKEELTNYSQSYIPDHAFRNVNFGANVHGIYGATPHDVLHGLKLGIMNYILVIFTEDEMNNSARYSLEQSLKSTLPHLRQGGGKQFPRLYFPNGITCLSNTTAEEVVGIVFVTYLLLLTSQGKNALNNKCEKMSVYRMNLYIKVFEKLLIFHQWLSQDTFWECGDRRAKNEARKSIKDLMKFICEHFERKSNQGWNISKMHELLHFPNLIESFGSPMNFDSGPCERMHKDVAKKPGRSSQKRHATFTLQAAQRLADRHVIDQAYQDLVASHQMTVDQPINSSTSAREGSAFILEITKDDDFYKVSTLGLGVMSSLDLDDRLYPDLVQYIVCYLSDECENMPRHVRCCSEIVDDDGNLFRAHPNYRGTGFWHDWAHVSYQVEDAQAGFTNVPAKILCFLPDGMCGEGKCYAVIHPCQWTNRKVSQLVTKWTLVPCSEASHRCGIPYDIVPVSALVSHCLVVPDLDTPGVIYEVADKAMWPTFF